MVQALAEPIPARVISAAVDSVPEFFQMNQTPSVLDTCSNSFVIWPHNPVALGQIMRQARIYALQ
jgi:hypothetical protein